jgi:hypothetical protein
MFGKSDDGITFLVQHPVYNFIPPNVAPDFFHPEFLVSLRNNKTLFAFVPKTAINENC